MASATLLFVMAAEGAKGDGGEGTSLDMMMIFGVGVRFLDLEFFFGVVTRSFAAKNKEENKIVNASLRGIRCSDNVNFGDASYK